MIDDHLLALNATLQQLHAIEVVALFVFQRGIETGYLIQKVQTVEVFNATHLSLKDKHFVGWLARNPAGIALVVSEVVVIDGFISRVLADLEHFPPSQDLELVEGYFVLHLHSEELHVSLVQATELMSHC